MAAIEIFKSIHLLDGTLIEIIVPTGGHYSRAFRKFSRQEEYDVIPFLFSELCLVNHGKKDESFYINLMIDDYLLINEVINEVSTRIR